MSLEAATQSQRHLSPEFFKGSGAPIQSRGLQSPTLPTAVQEGPRSPGINDGSKIAKILGQGLPNVTKICIVFVSWRLGLLDT